MNFPNLQTRKTRRLGNKLRRMSRKTTDLKRRKKEKTNLIVNMHLKRNYERKRVFSIKKMMIAKLKSTWKG